MGNIKRSIKDWADDDRPREKLLLKGKAALSDAELLAILIGSGNREETAVALSQRILIENKNSLAFLGRQTVKQLMQFKGIGEAKAIAIVAALELGQRRRQQEAVVLPIITSSNLVFELMHPLIADLNHEEFWVLYLNNSNKVVYQTPLSKGGLTGTLVDVRILFKIALEHQATGIILSHNHPSGKLEPSEADKRITRKIKEAGQLLDVALLDHVIVTEHGYYSFADEGIL